MKHYVIALWGAMCILPGCQAGMYVDNGTGRDFPSHWSKRIHVPGIARTYQVDAHLYRGGSPDAEGLAALKKLGVRTVISLRCFHDQEAGVRQAGLDYVRIPLNAWEGVKTIAALAACDESIKTGMPVKVKSKVRGS